MSTGEKQKPTRREIITAVESGIRRAQLHIPALRTLDESTELVEFIQNAAQQLADFRKEKKVADIGMDKFIPLRVSKTMARNMRDRGGITTVGEMLSMELLALRRVLLRRRVFLQEALLAMHRSVNLGKENAPREPEDGESER